MSGINNAYSQCYNGSNVWNESWVSCQISTNPNSQRGTSHWIHYEFEQAESIEDLWVWNANRAGEIGWGAKDVIIDYSTDGNTWISLGDFTFPQANGAANYAGFQGPSLNGIFVKEILVTIVSTYSSSSCASIGEIQFNIDPDACYGEIDECGVCNGPGEILWYLDSDGDGIGSPLVTQLACTQPAGYVENKEDYCDNGMVGWGEIGPLFMDNGCTGCHGNNALGGLDLTSYETAIQGGNKCGTGITMGSTLVDIINIDNYAGCGSPIGFPSMNQRVGGAIDYEEIKLIQQWVNSGTPNDCNCSTKLNVARNGTPKASSINNPNNVITRLNDGVIDNSQLAHTGLDNTKEWLEIDL